MARASEFEIIQRVFAPLSADAPGAFGLRNDAALWRPAAGCDGVVTTDCMVAGVHFLADDPPDSIAAKLLAVNLSDIAAMGARPSAYTLGAAWPVEIDDAWIAAFADGLRDVQSRAGISLIGGDTVATPGPLTFSLTAFGEVALGAALQRRGAVPGDRVFVSGTIGDAALGLRVLQGALADLSAPDRDFLINRYRRPSARSALGAGLAGLASAAIDVSDGLAADLGHIAGQSGVEIAVFADKLPVSASVSACIDADSNLSASVYGGGDDYELAFCVAPANIARVMALAAETETPVTEIGEVRPIAGETPQPPGTVSFFNAAGGEIEIGQRGFRHF